MLPTLTDGSGNRTKNRAVFRNVADQVLSGGIVRGFLRGFLRGFPPVFREGVGPPDDGVAARMSERIPDFPFPDLRPNLPQPVESAAPPDDAVPALLHQRQIAPLWHHYYPWAYTQVLVNRRAPIAALIQQA